MRTPRNPRPGSRAAAPAYQGRSHAAATSNFWVLSFRFFLFFLGGQARTKNAGERTRDMGRPGHGYIASNWLAAARPVGLADLVAIAF